MYSIFNIPGRQGLEMLFVCFLDWEEKIHRDEAEIKIRITVLILP